MANSYCDFSDAIAVPQKVYDDAVSIINVDFDDLPEWYVKAIGVKNEDDYWDFHCDDITTYYKDGYMHFYTESGEGNPHVFSIIMHHVLHHNDCDAVFTFEASYTCSKPRSGEFGGDTFMVSKDGWACTGDLNIHEMLRAKIKEKAGK